MENSLADIQWIRLAMAIDCEGCIQIIRSAPKGGPEQLALNISMVNTDVRLIDWARYEFGFSKIALSHKNNSHKQAYMAYLTGQHAAWIAENIKPHLLLKQEQAEIALEFQATIGRSGRRVAPSTRQLRKQLRLRLKGLHCRSHEELK